MKYTKKLLTLFFAVVLLIGSLVVFAPAQRRVVRVVKRPIVVRPYYYNNYYGYSRYYNPWYDSFYDPYFYDPYLRERQQRYYLQRELSGNKRELRKHLEEYNADGVITAKERRELDDDYRDVAKAERKLKEFNQDNGDGE